MRERIFSYAEKRYHTKPEYLWKNNPTYAVLRHRDSRNWYGILMRVPADHLTLSARTGPCPTDSDGRAEVLNVKIADPVQHDILARQRGYGMAYHMNKAGWLSVLPEMLPFEEVRSLLDQSYLDTGGDAGKKHAARRELRSWLIPSSVSYCDPYHFFDHTDTVHWTQSSNIIPGDTVYIYAGVPIGAILYQCTAVETDLPASGDLKKNFRSGREMILKLEKRFDETLFTREVLRKQYGVVSVRGPRYAPDRLDFALRRWKPL